MAPESSTATMAHPFRAAMHPGQRRVNPRVVTKRLIANYERKHGRAQCVIVIQIHKVRPSFLKSVYMCYFRYIEYNPFYILDLYV